jgi:hypothetical protein
MDQVVQDILDCLYDSFFQKWPDHDEQGIIAEQIRVEFWLPKCVDVTDGTLLPLAFWPSTDDYANYKGRKCFIL